MKKRLMSALLCLCMVICMMPTISLAADDTSADETITWDISEDGTLTISGTGEMQTAIGVAPWNDRRSEIKKVVIENGVTNVGDWAFSDCDQLESVSIADSVTSIGTGAFSRCSQLKSMNISENVKTIYNSAFSECSGLLQVTLPESLESIGEGAFSNCTELRKITIPKNVTKIDELVFDNCDSMTEINVDKENNAYYSSDGGLISKTTQEFMKFPQAKKGKYTIPEDVKSIAKNAFKSSSELTAVTILNGVTSIGENAFDSCSKLKSVTIPGSVTEIARDAFTKCGTLSDLTISDGVKNIADFAFYECSELKSVTIPNSVTSIGSNAFADCSGLQNITIPDSVTQLAGTVLDGTAYYTTDSNWKNGVLYCGNWIIASTDEVKTVKIPDGILGVADNAFMNKDVSSVEMPDSLRNIGANAFFGCSLKSLEIPASVKTVGEYGFGYVSVVDWDTWDYTIVVDADFVANVHEGGAAETYCKDNGITCVVENHNKVTDAAVPATCTEAGKTEGSHCEICGEVLKKQETIDATGHTEVTDAAVAPTCTTDGKTEGLHCSVCNEIIKAQETIKATGHSFTNYVYNNDAKPGKDGTETAACDHQGCNATDTRTKAGTAKPTVTFNDIDETQYYAAPVQWAVANEITDGMGDGTFGPNLTCTRGQIVTFLWRAKGKPEPTSTNNPFTDVNTNEYYGKAVLWAVEQGITTGTSTTTFSPNMGCTRAQVATFLWRAEGKPSSSVSNQFSDVDVSAYYGTAVLWATEKGITNGMGDGTFAPNATCTRGQIVTFLYRAMV